MEVQAVKLVSAVPAAPPAKASADVPAPGPGKDLPRAAGIDPAVVQDSRDKQAALARQISSYLRANSRALEFRIDAETGDPVITVRDADGNVVRQIPGGDALAMLRRVSVDAGTFVDSMV